MSLSLTTNPDYKELIKFALELARLEEDISIGSAIRYVDDGPSDLASAPAYDSSTIDILESFVSTHQSLLEKFGIKFSISDQSKIAQARYFELEIADIDKFINFLRTINRDTKLLDELKPFIRNYIQELFYKILAFNSSNADNAILLLTNLEDITDNITNVIDERLVRKLKKSIPFVKSGFLKEYLELSSYFKEQTQFGPWNWHVDNTIQSYTRQWNSIFSLLEIIQKKQSAIDFLKLCVVNFLDYANEAKSDVINNSQISHNHDLKNFREEYLDILVATINKLTELQNSIREK